MTNLPAYPWSSPKNRSQFSNVRDLLDKNGVRFAHIQFDDLGHEDTDAEIEAISRVLAVAPDLLEVAHSAASFGFHGMPEGEGPCTCSRCDMVREARAAISKATGGTS